MKNLISIIFLAFLIHIISAKYLDFTVYQANDNEWENYKLKFNKSYSANEEPSR